MYSALKKDGKRLYELARKGEVVEREARAIRVHSIALLEARGDRLVFRVHCSKGTYIRTLVEDIAASVGTVAYTASLHRESVGVFAEADMLDLGDAERLLQDAPEALLARLLPVDSALADWPQVQLAAEQSRAFVSGQAISAADAETGLVRVYGESQRFLGVGERGPGGLLAPRRVFQL